MTLDKLEVVEVWESGYWPEEWTHSVFIPLPKKGGLLQCSNYRTIALVSHASKILLRVILERMQTKIEERLPKNKLDLDQTVALEIRLQASGSSWKRIEKGNTLYLCFIDFKKAFDMVQHDQLWLGMLEMGFPPHLVQLLMQNRYKQQLAAVRTANLTSAWFHVKKGVRQGCNVSPCLFNMLAEQLMRKAPHGVTGGFKIGGKTISNLRYADDIVLLATSQ